MAFKIYKKNNYIIIEDTVAGKQYQGLAKNVFVYKDTLSETTYDFEGLTYNGLKGIALADLLDENDTAFVDEQAFIDFYTENTGNFNTGGATPINENTVKIKRRNTASDFIKAHGTCNLYDRMFIGTRQSKRVAMYYDMNDFTNKTLIDISEINPTDQGIESATPLTSLNKIVAPISNSRTLLVFENMDDISDYTPYVYAGLSAGVGFGASCGVVNDGTYILIASEKNNTYTTPTLFRINISDYSIDDTAPFPFGNGNGAHAGVSVDGYNVFTNNGSACFLASVNMSDLTYTEMDLEMDAITDDIVGIPFGNPLGYTAVAVLSEGSEPNGLNLAIINMDEMTIAYKVKCLPGIGMIYDEVNECLYIGSHLGYIQKVNLADLSNGTPDYKIARTFTARGQLINTKLKPNEFWQNEDKTKLFCTDWENEDGKGSLLEIELVEVANPIMTLEEFIYKHS